MAGPLVTPTLPRSGFRVVLADPPWRYETWAEVNGKAPPYPCLTVDELAALPRHIGLREAIADDCALVMWATFPMLAEALHLMREWGFAYRSGGAWAKMRQDGAGPAFGTGYIYRSAAEPWLMGVRGRPQIFSRAVRNLILAPPREHSRKPDDMRSMIEAQFQGPYLELFARERRPRWFAWGNETGKFGGAAA